MKGFAIDFNPAPRRRLRGVVLFALGAAAFAAASDMHFEQAQRAELQAQAEQQRLTEKKPRRTPTITLTAEQQRAADERTQRLAYDWNPILEELEAAAGEGLVVRQFAHDIASGKSTLRLEGSDLTLTTAALERIAKVLPESRALTIDALAQEVRDGQGVVLIAVTIGTKAAKPALL